MKFLFFLIIVSVFSCANGRFPRSVYQAVSEYELRRDNLIEVYSQLTTTESITWDIFFIKGYHNPKACITGTHQFGDFERHGSTRSFRRMMAWLIAYKKYFLGTGNYGNLISKVPELESAPKLVEKWLATISPNTDSGTDYGQNYGGDYDMGKSIYIQSSLRQF